MQNFLYPSDISSTNPNNNMAAPQLWQYPSQPLSVLQAESPNNPTMMQALISQASLGLISSGGGSTDNYQSWAAQLNATPAALIDSATASALIKEGMDESSCMMSMPHLSSVVSEHSLNSTSTSSSMRIADKAMNYTKPTPAPIDIGMSNTRAFGMNNVDHNSPIKLRRSWQEALSHSPYYTVSPEHQSSIKTTFSDGVSSAASTPPASKSNNIISSHDLNDESDPKFSSPFMPCTIVDNCRNGEYNLSMNPNLNYTNSNNIINHASKPTMNINANTNNNNTSMELNHMQRCHTDSTTQLKANNNSTIINYGNSAWPAAPNASEMNSYSTGEPDYHMSIKSSPKSHHLYSNNTTMIFKNVYPAMELASESSCKVSSPANPESASKKRLAGAVPAPSPAVKRANVNGSNGDQMQKNMQIQQRKHHHQQGSKNGTTRSGKASSRHPLGPALNTNGKPRAPQGSANDPQSLAARNRRERINARLKILQELVPNGSKVDLVTMLEKAINYVKFLQLQLRVLSNDEYWNGGINADVEDKNNVNACIGAQIISACENNYLKSESITNHTYN